MKHAKLWLTIIFLLGVGLRLIALGHNPLSLYFDEVSLGYEAFSVAQTGLDSHGDSWLQAIFPAYGDYKAPGYIWALAPMIKAFGLNDTVTRLPSAIAGSLLVLVVYGLVQELLKNSASKQKVGLLAALFTALSPWSLQFSRAAFEANLALLWFSLAVLCLLKARQQGWWLVVSSLAATLSVYTYFSVRFVWPLLAVVIILMYARDYLKQWRWLLIAIVLFGLGLYWLQQSPHYQTANQFRYGTTDITDNTDRVHEVNALRLHAGNQLPARLLYHRHWLLLKALAENIGDHLSPAYLFITGDPNLRHGTGVTGVMFLSFLPLFIIGWFAAFSQDKKFGLLLLSWWLIALLPAAVPETTPHALRSLNAMPVFSIILGIGGYWVCLKLLGKGRVGRLVLFAYVVLMCFEIITYLDYYHHHYPRVSQDEWHQNNTLVSAYILEQSNYDSVYADVGNNFFLYYLYYGRIDPRLVQARERELIRDNSFDLRLDRIDAIYFDVSASKALNRTDNGLLVTENINATSSSALATWTNVTGEPMIKAWVLGNQQTVQSIMKE